MGCARRLARAAGASRSNGSKEGIRGRIARTHSELDFGRQQAGTVGIGLSTGDRPGWRGIVRKRQLRPRMHRTAVQTAVHGPTPRRPARPTCRKCCRQQRDLPWARPTPWSPGNRLPRSKPDRCCLMGDGVVVPVALAATCSSRSWRSKGHDAVRPRTDAIHPAVERVARRRKTPVVSPRAGIKRSTEATTAYFLPEDSKPRSQAVMTSSTEPTGTPRVVDASL